MNFPISQPINLHLQLIHLFLHTKTVICSVLKTALVTTESTYNPRISISIVISLLGGFVGLFEQFQSFRFRVGLNKKHL